MKKFIEEDNNTIIPEHVRNRQKKNNDKIKTSTNIEKDEKIKENPYRPAGKESDKFEVTTKKENNHKKNKLWKNFTKF